MQRPCSNVSLLLCFRIQIQNVDDQWVACCLHIWVLHDVVLFSHIMFSHSGWYDALWSKNLQNFLSIHRSLSWFLLIAVHGINILASGRCDSNFKSVIFEHIDGLVQDCSISCALPIEILQSCTKLSTCYEIALRWMLQNTFDWKAKLFQVMAWCHQATSHYLSQYLPKSMPPYYVTRSQ